MKQFMDENFLLNTKTAQILYHEHAANMPIIDFHNHLNPQEIYEDVQYQDITEVWLNGDHYKWRLLRANGIPEELVTNKEADPYERFCAWAKTVQDSFGNPLYHWTHMELQRYFHIFENLSPKTQDKIWKSCNEQLKTKDFTTRNLLRRMDVEVLCTTDDPADDLKYHKALREEGFDIQVLPTFRPEKAMAIDKEGFVDYLSHLSEVSGIIITDIEQLMNALEMRVNYFVKEAGCRVSDHSLEGRLYVPAAKEEANQILQARLRGEVLTQEQVAMYKGYIFTNLGRIYHKHDMVMQLHIGAVRNNSSRLFHKLGVDVGLDSLDDINYAVELSQLLDSMDKIGELPKTILYCMNPKDNLMLSAMAGNFQDGTTQGKIQGGAAWWMCDNKVGMEAQLDALSQVGLISRFVGMVTDSRSFLSFSRHEYFRRILCNYIGEQVENGEYPCDMEYLGQMVENICYYNAKEYFGL